MSSAVQNYVRATVVNQVEAQADSHMKVQVRTRNRLLRRTTAVTIRVPVG
jgi:hypothetical protein